MNSPYKNLLACPEHFEPEMLAIDLAETKQGQPEIQKHAGVGGHYPILLVETDTHVKIDLAG